MAKLATTLMRAAAIGIRPLHLQLCHVTRTERLRLLGVAGR
jgi:hypothetical protein